MKKTVILLSVLILITSSCGLLVKSEENKLQTSSDTEIKTVAVMKNIDELTENDLYGISVTRWVFEGADGINQYQFEWCYPCPDQNIKADYGYYFGFSYPNNVGYSYFTPITFQNGDVLWAKIIRKGTFEIKGNVLTINFTEATHRIPDTFGKLAEPIHENLTVIMEVETDGRTELHLKQTAGENIFEENDKNKKIKFVASILELLQ